MSTAAITEPSFNLRLADVLQGKHSDWQPKRLRGRGHAQHVDLLHGSFHLVIINPSFTRPTSHEANAVPVSACAGFAKSEEEQRLMSDSLKRIVSGPRTAEVGDEQSCL